MKIHIYLYTCALALTLIVAGCGKEADFKPNVSSSPLTTSGSGSGGGTGTGGTPVGSSYQPLTANSTWTYQNTENGTVTDATTVTATSNTKLINGKTFTAFTEKTGSTTGNSYYLVDGNNYTNNSEDFADGVGTDILYLNDKEAVGYTWTGTAIASNPLVSGTYTGKIMEKGVTRTILGKSYPDVIHTQVILHITVIGFGGDTTCDFYAAKGVGLIELDTDDGTDKTTSKIMSYTIK
jgi:hypothetical protein